MLSEKQIKEYQKIYKEQFGKEISKEEALRQGIKLVNLMKVLLENQIKKLNNQKGSIK